MLKLSKLTLAGFKSFPDTAEFAFGDGITAVVGPNGCGKSNLLDATSWVLGEQSARSLRGTRMADVIFGGTAKRPQQNMAEAVMTLKRIGDDGAPEIIEISRQIYRDGETEYILNGRSVRLQDIKDLLAKEGLGEEAYFFIEQGRVEAILASKPEERRAIIEEAAQIGAFKQKHHQTTLKLSNARENLDRVEDIIKELEKRMASLKIQAGRARRHSELSHRIAELKRIIYAQDFLRFEKESEDIRRELEALKTEDARKLARITSLDAEIAEKRAHIAREREQSENMRNALSALYIDIERDGGLIKYSDERFSELAKRNEEISAEIETEKTKKQDAEKALFDAENSLKNFEAEFKKEESAERELASALKRLEDEKTQIDGEREEISANRLSFLDEENRIKNNLIVLQNEAGRTEHERGRLAKETASVMSEISLSQKTKDDFSQNLISLKNEGRNLKIESDKTEESLKKIAEAQKDASRRRSTLDKAIGEAEVRIGLLEDEEARALAPIEDIVSKSEGRLFQFIEVNPSWERAADALWGDFLQSLIFEDEKAFFDAYKTAREREATLTLFFAGAGRASDALVGGETLRSKVKCDKQREEIFKKLPDALLAENLEDALKIQKEHPQTPVAVKSGEILLPGGFLKIGSARGALSRRRETEDLKLRRDNLSRERDALRDEIKIIEESAERANSEQKIIAENFSKLSADSLVLQSNLENAESSLAGWLKKLDGLKTEDKLLLSQSESVNAKTSEYEEKLASLRSELSALDDRLSRLDARYDAAEEDAGSIGEKHLEKREVLAGMRERADALKERVGSARRALEEISARIQKSENALRNNEETQAEIKSERARLSEKLARNLRERDAKKDIFQSAAQKLAEEEKNLSLLEDELRSAHREYEKFKDVLTQAEVKNAEIAGRLEQVKQKIAEDFENTSPGDLVGGLTDEEAEMLHEVMTLKLKESEDKLRHLGAVNLLAAEEFEEIETRFKFLSAQKEDIISSIKSLEETIRDLEAHSKERFKDAFIAVRENFQAIFARLFEGGDSDLKLVPEDDYLDGGIEIVAQPPGKKLQSIQLLSGGEKALCAIALLFAVFEYRPAPFCFLDEVDAALDDANIDRFGKLLKERSSKTQFICITHNKRTMTLADTLYGITMEDAGVSKTVSLKFEEAEKYAQ